MDSLVTWLHSNLKLSVSSILFFIFCLSTPLFSSDFVVTPNEFAFKRNYLSFEFARNHPYGDSQNQFGGGDVSEFVGFRHLLFDDWILGVRGGFIRLEEKNSDNKISLLSISEESLRIIRIQHPLYLAIGAKLIYLFPAAGKKIPPEKETRYKREIAFGLSAQLNYIYNKRVVLSFRIDRWRGVDREVFHALESAVGLNYSLPE